MTQPSHFLMDNVGVECRFLGPCTSRGQNLGKFPPLPLPDAATQQYVHPPYYSSTVMPYTPPKEMYSHISFSI